MFWIKECEPDSELNLGYCKRNPPQIIVPVTSYEDYFITAGQLFTMTKFPVTLESDWCGELKAATLRVSW